MPTPRLWYDRPAEVWTDALPLGNGRIGLMVHGGTSRDHIQINDGTAWSGSPRSETAEPVVTAEVAAHAIASARAAITDERFDDAAEALQALQHRHSQAYVTFGDLTIVTEAAGEVDHYERALHLDTATHVVEFTSEGSRIRRETFVSHPHGVAIIRVRSDSSVGMKLALELATPLRVLESAGNSDGASIVLQLPSNVSPPFDADRVPVTYSDDARASMQGVILVRWDHDGHPSALGTAATGVHEATIYVTTDTTFSAVAREPIGSIDDIRGRAESRIEAARAAGFELVQRYQRADHAALFSRMSIETGEDPELPTDERLRRGNAHEGGVLAADPALAALLYQYGRYLLICSSRAGGVPANLQGIWSDLVQPPWSGNYTTNINVEMNYWPAEVANLSECAEPLFDLIEALSIAGVETAARLYGAPGWVAHHNTDPWAYTQPVGWGVHDPRWAFWPLAGAWLSRHLWEHLLFGADDRFARRAWPIIRSAAQFALHWLVEGPDGSLGTSPSTSPENVYAQADGRPGSVDQSSTLDLVLISDLLFFTTQLASRLGEVDDVVAHAADEARRRIPSPKVGKNGMIPEWAADRPQVELNHRHVSHLYFAFPGDMHLTPALRSAVAASLDARGEEATGWSVAWKIAIRARLRQPERVSDLLRLVYRDMEVDRGEWIGGLYRNLFVAHPPFQIDGNFGFVAGLSECLMQSHDGLIELLPAVPRELATGSISGVMARPGVEVDIVWNTVHGEVTLVSARLRATNEAAATEHTVVWRHASAVVDLRANAVVELDSNLAQTGAGIPA